MRNFLGGVFSCCPKKKPSTQKAALCNNVGDWYHGCGGRFLQASARAVGRVTLGVLTRGFQAHTQEMFFPLDACGWKEISILEVPKIAMHMANSCGKRTGRSRSAPSTRGRRGHEPMNNTTEDI